MNLIELVSHKSPSLASLIPPLSFSVIAETPLNKLVIKCNSLCDFNPSKFCASILAFRVELTTKSLHLVTSKSLSGLNSILTPLVYHLCVFSGD